MLKFNRKHKKLIIPVGINPSYNIDSSTLYNTSDATATANDIISGKVSYSGDGKVIGTLDIDDLIEESYNEGVAEQKSKLTTITITENGTYNREDGYNEVVVDVPDLNGNYDEGYNEGVAEQKSKLTTITITENGTYNREDGYNEVIVDVPDLNGNYDEGYSEGVAVGREEIITEQSDATITPQTVLKGEIGYGSNNERIVGEFEFVEGFNYGKIGYSQELSNELNRETAEKLAYSKSLYDAWDPNRTSAQKYFQNDSSLVYAPNVNTINVTDMSYMLYQCPNLSIIPDYNYDKVTNMQNFCSYSGNKSLNLDLKSCTNAQMITSYNKSIEDVSINFNNTSTNCYGLVYGCEKLKNVTLKNVNMTDSRSVFYNCGYLSNVDFDNVTLNGSLDSTFQGCSKLTSVPQFFTSNNVTDTSYMFSGCSEITSVPQFDTSKTKKINAMFRNCSKLETIPEFDFGSVDSLPTGSSYQPFRSCGLLHNIGGFKDLGKGFKDETVLLNLYDSVITYESCMNIINKLYDLNLINFTHTATIDLNTTSFNYLSPEDIAIATSKGWTIQ